MVKKRIAETRLLGMWQSGAGDFHRDEARTTFPSICHLLTWRPTTGSFAFLTAYLLPQQAAFGKVFKQISDSSKNRAGLMIMWRPKGYLQVQEEERRV